MVNHEKNKSQSEILVKQIEEFVTYLGVEKNYAINTIASYERDLLKFLSFLINRNIADWLEIESDTVNLFVMGLRHSEVSGKSIRRYLSSIRGFFNFLIDNGVMVNNPALSIQTPKIDRVLPKTIDFDDLRNMMSIKTGYYSELRSVLLFELLY